MDYFVGLDLGQLHEFTALAVVERTWGQPAPGSREPLRHYAVRHLERFPMGTPYPSIVCRIVELFEDRAIAGSDLVIDRTGVGRPVVQMFERANIDALLHSVVLTTSLQTQYDSGTWIVPKLELVGVMQVLLQSRRITIASALPESATLVRELATFRAKPPAPSLDPYVDWREGSHDDLVLAVAVAVWQGEREVWYDPADVGFAFGRWFSPWAWA